MTTWTKTTWAIGEPITMAHMEQMYALIQQTRQQRDATSQQALPTESVGVNARSER